MSECNLGSLCSLCRSEDPLLTGSTQDRSTNNKLRTYQSLHTNIKATGSWRLTERTCSVPWKKFSLKLHHETLFKPDIISRQIARQPCVSNSSRFENKILPSFTTCRKWRIVGISQKVQLYFYLWPCYRFPFCQKINLSSSVSMIMVLWSETFNCTCTEFCFARISEFL